MTFGDEFSLLDLEVDRIPAKNRTDNVIDNSVNKQIIKYIANIHRVILK